MLSPSSEMRERSENSDWTLSSSFDRTRTTGFVNFLVINERMILSNLHKRVNGWVREGEREREREKEKGYLVFSSFISKVVARLSSALRSALVSTRCSSFTAASVSLDFVFNSESVTDLFLGVLFRTERGIYMYITMILNKARIRTQSNFISHSTCTFTVCDE